MSDIDQPQEQKIIELEEVFEWDDKREYYWTEVYKSCYNRDLERLRECYFAIKALNVKIKASGKQI